jgi:L-arabinokinase
MTLAWYISSHGYGHASRDIEIINALLRLRGDLRIVLRTSVDPGFVRASAGRSLDIEAVQVDTGVAQIDSLTPDEDRTARDAAAFYAAFDERVDAEAAWLRTVGARLVVGDIPPLAFAAADRARLPSAAVGNFTWDWIYAGYPHFDELAPGVIDVIAQAYRKATLALRMPLHGGFETMRAVTRDIPLVARQSGLGRDEVRRRLGVSGGRPVVLPSFGGFGLALSLTDLEARGEMTLLDDDAGRLTSLGLRYEDLVAAADVVVSKLGYGIASECIANDTALVYAPRGRFVEQDVLVRELPQVLRCAPISTADLRAGRWHAAIEAVLALPAPAERWPIDGASVAAELMSRAIDDGRSQIADFESEDC